MIRRTGFSIFCLALAAGMAYLILELLSQRAHVSTPVSILLMALAMVVGFAIGQLLGPTLFPVSNAQYIRPEAPRQNWAWLRPRSGGGRSSYPLNRDRTVIGREVSCHVMLNDNSVSREHSAILKVAEGYYLRDLGSSNGTYVNGQRIQECLLQNGDQVSIGNVQFNFEAPQTLNVAAQAGKLGGGLSLDPTASSSAPLPLVPIDDDEEGTEVWKSPQG